MAEIYTMNLFEPTTELYNKMLELVGENKREKLLRLKQHKKQLQSLIADVLLRVILCARFNIDVNDMKFDDMNGKPYLVGESVCFNVSHSENMVAVAFSDRNIGVDLEKTRSVNPKLIDRYFTICEKEYINVDLPDWESRFFEIWTKKEAFLKRSGVGLRVKLNELETKTCEGIKTYNLDGFVLSVCCDDKNFNIYNNEICSTILDKYFSRKI